MAMRYALTLGPREQDDEEELPYDEDFIWDDDVPFWYK